MVFKGIYRKFPAVYIITEAEPLSGPAHLGFSYNHSDRVNTSNRFSGLSSNGT